MRGELKGKWYEKNSNINRVQIDNNQSKYISIKNNSHILYIFCFVYKYYCFDAGWVFAVFPEAET